jgi:hypothetical protein
MRTRLMNPAIGMHRPEIRIGDPRSPLEREADRIADRVMNMHVRTVATESPSPPRPSSGTRASASGYAPLPRAAHQVPADPRSAVEATALQARAVAPFGGRGEALAPIERQFFEARFAAPLGSVRVHTGSAADAAARSVGARAYTLGAHIFFRTGEWSQGGPARRRLLAHELAHVVQQAEGGASSTIIRRAGAGNCALPAETVDERRDELARAGRAAHSQIQGYFSDFLHSEVPIPRATKALLGVSCPPFLTPAGRADLWGFGGGLSAVQVGEIKSINGLRYAQPDVDHYRLRLRELAGRFTGGGPCSGAATQSDRQFDADWLDGNLARRRPPAFEPLTSVVPDTPISLGPFWGDPLFKDLKCQRRAGGAVAYWCTLRRLREEERERERVRLRIPVGERVRRTAPVSGTRPPRIIEFHPGFREVIRQLPARVPAYRIVVVAVPSQLFIQVDGAMRMQQSLRPMQVNIRGNPIFQFRALTWGTLGVVLGGATIAAIAAAVAVAAAVPAGAAVGAGVVAAATTGAATGTAAATAATTGAVVIPLFQTAAAQTIAKAAAVVIVAGTLTAGASEAHAQTSVQRGMSNPQVAAVVDVTDDPFGLSGGYHAGSRLTVDGRPYRVVVAYRS